MENNIILKEFKNYLSFTHLKEDLKCYFKEKNDTYLEFSEIQNRENQVYLYIENTTDLKISLKSDVNIQIYIITRNPLNLNVICEKNVLADFHNIIQTDQSIQNHIMIDLNGENSVIKFNTLDFLNAQSEHKNHILINHFSKNSNSLMKNNLICQNNGKITLDGISKIIKGAKLANARQENHGVLLDSTGFIKAIPTLLIEEFDCKASHGAAIGKISDENLFYLMSRGLSKKDSMTLIIQGLIKPFIETMRDDVLKNQLFAYFNE